MLERVRHVSAHAPPGAQGLVCIEGVRPEVAHPLTVTRSARPWLVVVEGRRFEGEAARGPVDGRVRWVEAFRLGGITVRPAGARLDGLERIEARGGVSLWGLPADRAVTVVGELRDGEIAGGDPFVVSSAGSCAALARRYHVRARRERRDGPLLVAIGAVLALGAGWWIRRVRRAGGE